MCGRKGGRGRVRVGFRWQTIKWSKGCGRGVLRRTVLYIWYKQIWSYGIEEKDMVVAAMMAGALVLNAKKNGNL
jgi:hypothetical protein